MTKSGMLRGLFGIFLIVLMMSLMIASISAITGSLGNARMVISKDENGNPVKAGDTIEKYVLIKNVNEEEIKVGLRASGDLAKYIELKETEFMLAPGTDKKAYFTIKVPSNGTTESRIEVTFSSETQKNGVGLASTIIVIAEEGDGSNTFNLFENFNKNAIIFIATGIMIIILILLLISYSKRKNKLKKSAEKL